MPITYQWRGWFTNDEVNALHAEAFETPTNAGLIALRGGIAEGAP